MYIHELENWPQLHWDSNQLAEKLAAVRHRQGRILGRLESLGFQFQAETLLHTLTQDVIKSSEIEGEILNRDQVRSSLARRLGVDIGALTPADRHVEGVIDVMLDATQHYDAPLTRERLFGWHAALFPTGYSGMSPIRVAGWRDESSGTMRVVSGGMGHERIHYEAPAADRVPEEMRKFLVWFNDDTGGDLVLKAGVAHLWFVTVHPFADGNGRIARAIADMMLARSERSPQRFYSMSAQIREERNDYYDMLESTQKGGLDITLWLAWFLDCLDRALNHAEETLAAVLRKARFWERFAAETLNERQKMMLNKLLNGFEGKLTSSKWAKIAKCSPDTALRDIEDLMKRGVLKKDPAGGRSTSYSLAE